MRGITCFCLVVRALAQTSTIGPTARGPGELAPSQEKVRKIVRVTDFGAKGRAGSQDDTGAIQNAINSLSNGGTLYFAKPSRYYQVTRGLQLSGLHNILIQGAPGAEIRFKPGIKDVPYRAWPDFGKDSVIRIVDSRDVTIDGLVINGNISNRPANAGSESQNSVILIAGSTNVTVRNCVLKEGMTDGVLVIENSTHTPNINVLIEDNQILNSRRNNLSGVAQFGLRVKGNTVSGAGAIQGTAPMAGIDIEPDYVTIPSLSADVDIEGNTITSSAGAYAISCGGLGTTGLTVANNSIHDNKGYGIDFDSYNTSDHNSRAILIGNNIANNGGTGVRVNGRNLDVARGNKIRSNSWGMQIFSSDGLVITDNVFESNANGGITNGTTAPLGFLDLIVRGNIFRDNNSAGGVANGAGWVLTAAPASATSILVFDENLVYGSAAAMYLQSGLNIAGSCRCVGSRNTAYNTQSHFGTFAGIIGDGNHIFGRDGLINSSDSFGGERR